MSFVSRSLHAPLKGIPTWKSTSEMIHSTGQVGSDHWKRYNHAKSGHQNGRASAELTGKNGRQTTAHEHRTRGERPITNSSREVISIDKVKNKTWIETED